MKKFTELQISKDIFASILLFTGVIGALIISNNVEALKYYRHFINIKFYIGFDDFQLNKTILKWVNDGLMAIFFFMLGLEMKYHIIQGEFKNRKILLLPTIAALGGFIVPSLLYYLINLNNPEGQAGWAIPIATDTAFVLAIISFFKDKITDNVKIFLIGLSIIDDVIAVIILAIFYSPDLNLINLSLCCFPLLILAIFNILQVSYKNFYYIVGFILWLFTVNSGVHGTIAGIATAFLIPVKVKQAQQEISLVKEMESSTHNIVAFFVLPLFAFVNCELPFHELSLQDFISTVAIGSFVGLLCGKGFGIYLFSMIMIKLKYCNLPHGANNLLFLGVSILCGIGFTLSLFIGLQAFEPVILENQMKIGVISASFLSALIGAYLIAKALKAKN